MMVGLPIEWDFVKYFGPGAAYYNSKNHLRVIITPPVVQADGKEWLHVSLSRAKRLPSWPDIKSVKDHFIGKDKVAIQVFPKASSYVNIHPFCLHLWSCMDETAIPEFSGVIEGVKTI